MTVIVKPPFTQLSPLRELCRRYASGKLTREDYLLARTQLLDQLAGNLASSEDVAVITAPLRAGAVAADADITAPQWKDKKRSASTVPPASTERRVADKQPSPLQQPEPTQHADRKKPLPLGGIAAAAIAALVVVGAGAYFFTARPAKNEVSAAPVSQSAAVAAAPTASEDTPFDAALNRFKNASFNSGSVDLLLQRWQSLDANQKLSARSTLAFTSFRQDLISRRDALLAISHPDKSNMEATALLSKIAEAMTLTDLQKSLAEQAVIAKADESAKVSHAINTDPTPKAIDKSTVGSVPVTAAQTPADVVAAKPSKQSAQELAAVEKADSAARLSAQPTLNRSGGGCSAEQLNSRKRACHDALKSGGDAPELIVIASGAFTMGGDGADQSARHSVEVKAFAIGRNEISVAEYAKYCQAENVACPKSEWGDGYPVVDISWQDANNYLHWLSVQTGIRYRLPTEAEWEYVARAGTNTSFPWPGEDGEKPTPSEVIYNTAKPVDVAENYKSINPNPWKVFHMQGNVREWVQDNWSAAKSDTQYVVRGGDYRDTRLEQLNAAARLGLPATSHDKYTGFRVARDL